MKVDIEMNRWEAAGVAFALSFVMLACWAWYLLFLPYPSPTWSAWVRGASFLVGLLGYAMIRDDEGFFKDLFGCLGYYFVFGCASLFFVIPGYLVARKLGKGDEDFGPLTPLVGFSSGGYAATDAFRNFFEALDHETKLRFTSPLTWSTGWQVFFVCHFLIALSCYCVGWWQKGKEIEAREERWRAERAKMCVAK